MDVRMPDGTVVRNVPEGTTQEDLMDRLNRSRQPVTSTYDRFFTGAMDPLVGAAQMMDKGSEAIGHVTGFDPLQRARSAVDKALGGTGQASSMNDYVRERDRNYKAPEGIDFARIAGNILNPATIAGGVAAGGGLVGAATGGAFQAGLAPTRADMSGLDYVGKKATDIGLGAATGAAIHGASKGMGKVLSKAVEKWNKSVITPTPEAAVLQKAGITLTPGQAAGGALNDLEQKASSGIFGGPNIEKGRARAMEEFQTHIIEKASGIKGVNTVDAANKAVSDLYNQAVPHLKPTPEGFANAANAINKSLKNPQLTPEQVKVFDSVLTDKFANYAKLDGAGLKQLDSELGRLARDYSTGAASPADRVLGEQFRAVRQALREGLEVGLPDAAREALKKANDAYRQLVPVNIAASARADKVIVPRALEKAIARQAGRDVSRMPANDVLDAAVKVFTKTVPDSGTAGRVVLPGAVVAGAAAPGPATAAAIAAWLASKGMYSKTGSDFLTGNSGARDALAKMLAKGFDAASHVLPHAGTATWRTDFPGRSIPDDIVAWARGGTNE